MIDRLDTMLAQVLIEAVILEVEPDQEHRVRHRLAAALDDGLQRRNTKGPAAA